MGTLYVVATPIGNLGDLSPRAAEVLRSVPLIAAEDTRVTRKLLNHIESKARLTSYHEDSGPGRLAELLSHLESADLALTTDAGTPGISDPGAELVRRAAEAGHTVTPVAGPSAITAALSVSGFPANSYMFIGYPTRKAFERRRLFEEIEHLLSPAVLLESPHRVAATLKDIAAVMPERVIVVCRELTKLHEEVFRGTAAAAAAHFREPRGEFVIVLGPGEEAEGLAKEEFIAESIEIRMREGLRGRRLVEQVMADTGEPRSRVYEMVLEVERESR
jgi:16S rRNA (cytidine1402-2'-O)-methyltransferase